MRISFVLLFLFCVAVGFSQQSFSVYKVVNFGFISIPSNMEVQSGLYKKLAENFHLLWGTIDYEILENRVVFQQKGVNEGNGSDTYARIILETHLGKPGDYRPLNSTDEYTRAELNEIEDAFSDESFSNSGIKIVTWNGVENYKVNGKYSSIRVSYVRQISDNPYVCVEILSIENNDRMHVLTFSYRIKDSIPWFSLFDKVKSSITIDIH